MTIASCILLLKLRPLNMLFTLIWTFFRVCQSFTTWSYAFLALQTADELFDFVLSSFYYLRKNLSTTGLHESLPLLMLPFPGTLLIWLSYTEEETEIKEYLKETFQIVFLK